MASEIMKERLKKYLLRQEKKKLKEKELKRKKKKREKEREKRKLEKEKAPTKVKKKKVGRPKKRGPKKKRIRRKIVKVIKERPLFNFKIISSLNGKQNGYIGQYHTYSDAYNKLIELEKCNNTIIFPRKVLNSTTINKTREEYLLLEKNRDGTKTDGMLRNEFGKLVCHKITNNEKWVIRDKINRLVEETFWVYGYCPKTDRKTFTWIYDNLLIGSINTVYDIIRVLIYKNKLIIKYDDKPMSIIMCKNTSDCIRMYNLISTKIKDAKNKQIICIGTYSNISEHRRELEKEIMVLTGWNKTKIQRSTN